MTELKVTLEFINTLDMVSRYNTYAKKLKLYFHVVEIKHGNIHLKINST